MPLHIYISDADNELLDAATRRLKALGDIAVVCPEKGFSAVVGWLEFLAKAITVYGLLKPIIETSREGPSFMPSFLLRLT